MILCDSTFLHGLKHIEVLPEDKVSATSAKSGSKRKGSAKKAQESVSQESDPRDLDTAQAVVRALNINDLKKLHLQPINDMGVVLEICLLQFMASELLSRLFQRQQSPFIFLAACMGSSLCMYYLLRTARFPMTLDGRMHPGQGTVVVGLIFIFAFIVMLVITLFPSGILDIDMQDAATGAVQGWTSLHKSLKTLSSVLSDASDAFNNAGMVTLTAADDTLPSPDEPSQSDTAPEILRLICTFVTSALSGLIAALFILPAQRLAQCIATTLNPPAALLAASTLESETMPLKASALQTTLVFLTEAAPAAALLLWIRPVSEGLLGLDASHRAMAQGAALLLVGFLQLCSVRTLIQGYLSTALERWWLAKHSRTRQQKAKKNTAFVTASLINNTCAMLPRVSQQLLAPAFVFIVLGCVICDAVGLGKGELGKNEVVTLYRAAAFVVPPPLCVHSVARTVAFFGLLSMSSYSVIVLCLRRAGVLKSTNV